MARDFSRRAGVQNWEKGEKVSKEIGVVTARSDGERRAVSAARHSPEAEVLHTLVEYDGCDGISL